MLYRLAKNIGALTISEFVSRGLGFVLSIVLARSLGEAGFGQYAYALALVSVLSIVSNFGLSVFMVRDVARVHGLAGEYLGKAVMVKSIVALLCVLGALSVNLLLGYPWELILVALLLSLSLPFQSLLQSCQSIFQALERMEYIGGLSVARSTLSLLLIVGVLSLGYALPTMMFMQTVSYAAIAGLAFYVLKRQIGPVRLSFPQGELLSFVRGGLPFLYITLVYVLFYRMDVLMLQKMKGEAAVGWYGAAYELVNGFYFIPIILSTALFPVFSRQSSTSLEELRESCGYALKYLLMMAVPLSVGLWILAPEIIPLLYGDRFLLSIGTLQVLSATLCLFFPDEILAYVLTSLDRARELVLINIAGLATNIALNLWLIPVYGHRGAAVATVMALAVATLLTYWRVAACLKRLPFFSLYAKPLLSAAGALAILYLFRVEHIALKALVGMGSYVGLLFLCNAITLEEIQQVRKAVSHYLVPVRTQG